MTDRFKEFATEFIAIGVLLACSLLLAALLTGCNENNVGTCLEYNPVTGVCLKKGDPTPTPTPGPQPGPCAFAYGCDRLDTTASGQGVYRCPSDPPGLGVSLSILTAVGQGQIAWVPVGDPRGLVFAPPGSAILPCYNGCCIQGLLLP